MNITLSLPADLIRKVKVWAAERDISISAIVTNLLIQMVGTGKVIAGVEVASPFD